MEQIYTIPVNEAFDLALEHPEDGCPVCSLYRRLEENELERILGAAMMEPDVRIRTNRTGFCADHFGKMCRRKNRLGLALMLESHLSEWRSRIAPGGPAALLHKPAATVRDLAALESSCYVCERIEFHLSRMVDTVLLLWESDPAFREKFAAQPRFCLPHYRRLLQQGERKLPKKRFAAFAKEAQQVVMTYFEKLCTDVSWYCKKFDYRYQEEPWYDSKDAVERAIGFLSGTEGRDPNDH